MQTLKNIHKEYLNKLAEEIVNMACVSECKCNSDDSTEKKKCLFRKTLNGSDKVLVDLWFDLIDAVSEMIYTKTVDDMAYPDLIREHFSQTKAKSFYEVLSDEFESVILEIYIKVCLKISDVCRENPGFEKIVDYAKEQLLEYFTFETAFSYSRYMIENHSYIKDWFAVADMDTIKMLEIAKEEPPKIYALFSEINCEFTESIEDLLEHIYKEMYKKCEKDLLSIFFDDVNEDAYYAKVEELDGDEEEYYPAVSELISDYLQRPLPEEMFYEYVWERIAYIVCKKHDNKAIQKSASKAMGYEGTIPPLEKQKEYYKGKKKLEESRKQIYLSQMKMTNDDLYVKELNRSGSSESKGDVKGKILNFYDTLFGIDVLNIYIKEPYNKKEPKSLLLPKHAYIPDYMKKCPGCRKTCFNCGIKNAQTLIQIFATALFIMVPDCKTIEEEFKFKNGKRCINWDDIYYTFDSSMVEEAYRNESDEEDSDDDCDENVASKNTGTQYYDLNCLDKYDSYQEYLDQEMFTKMYYYEDQY